jgi:hypothetical protein
VVLVGIEFGFGCRTVGLGVGVSNCSVTPDGIRR